MPTMTSRRLSIAVLVDVGHALAEHRAGYVELELGALHVHARLDEPGVERVEFGARDVVLLDRDLDPAVQARDISLRARRLTLQLLDVLARGVAGATAGGSITAAHSAQAERRRHDHHSSACPVCSHL